MKKIYTLKSFCTPENRSIIFPLLFDLYYVENEVTRHHFCLVDDISSADIAILPLDINWFLVNDFDEYKKFIVSATRCSVPIWVYSAGDFGITVSDSVTTFRLGGFDSKLSRNTHIMPCFVTDPYRYILRDDWSPVSKIKKPTIGFVGNADGSAFKWFKEFLLHYINEIRKILGSDLHDRQSFFPSSIKRFKLLRNLARDKRLYCNFVYRKKYRGGALTAEERAQTTLEFYTNVRDSLYTFCLRGAGNFSVRFYETLLSGRIPLLVATDCRLPLSDVIDWNKHCVVADEHNVVEKLIEFHVSKSEGELNEIQKNNRNLMLNTLNRVCYFIHIAENLKK